MLNYLGIVLVEMAMVAAQSVEHVQHVFHSKSPMEQEVSFYSVQRFESHHLHY